MISKKNDPLCIVSSKKLPLPWYRCRDVWKQQLLSHKQIPFLDAPLERLHCRSSSHGDSPSAFSSIRSGGGRIESHPQFRCEHSSVRPKFVSKLSSRSTDVESTRERRRRVRRRRTDGRKRDDGKEMGRRPTEGIDESHGISREPRFATLVDGGVHLHWIEKDHRLQAMRPQRSDFTWIGVSCGTERGRRAS